MSHICSVRSDVALSHVAAPMGTSFIRRQKDNRYLSLVIFIAAFSKFVAALAAPHSIVRSKLSHDIIVTECVLFCAWARPSVSVCIQQLVVSRDRLDVVDWRSMLFVFNFCSIKRSYEGINSRILFRINSLVGDSLGLGDMRGAGAITSRGAEGDERLQIR